MDFFIYIFLLLVSVYVTIKQITDMISKQEFDNVANGAISNFSVVFPKMVSYKNYIQREILNIATRQELEDVRDCRINHGMINKLASLAKR